MKYITNLLPYFLGIFAFLSVAFAGIFCLNTIGTAIHEGNQKRSEILKAAETRKLTAEEFLMLNRHERDAILYLNQK